MFSIMKELNTLIESIDFNILWDKFSKSKYAIFNSEKFYINDDTGIDINLTKEDSCFVGNVDERFKGNTAISINKNYVAIVDEESIRKNVDCTKLASLIIHEMFHCFQYSNGEKRFPNEILGIDYPITYENIYYRTMERKSLLDACLEMNKDKKLKLLSLFFRIRKEREKLIGGFIDYEKATESVEGTAVYVEYKALTQLIPHSDISILKEYINGFIDINNLNMRIRHSTYNQGLLLGLIADELIPNWKTKYDSSELYLIDFFKDELNIDDVDMELEYKHVVEIEKCITNRNKEIDIVFDEFDMKSNGNSIIDGLMITGFDPMNIVKRGQEIIHKNFLRIKIGDSEQVIKGPVKAIVGKNMFDIKRIEW